MKLISTFDIANIQQGYYKTNVRKFRDTSEARKLMTSCGEYREKTQETQGLFQNANNPIKDNFLEAVTYNRHLQDYPGFEKPEHQQQAIGQKANTEKMFVKNSHYNGDSIKIGSIMDGHYKKKLSPIFNAMDPK